MTAQEKKIFLTAPAGHIGSRAASRLVERGQNTSVLALERSVARLPDSVREAAEIHIGTMDNERDIVAASQGAAAMLFVLPPVFVDHFESVWQRYIDNSLAAIETNGIERVVFISSQGAAADAPLVMRLSYEAEERLRVAVPHVRSLRAGPLMENLFADAHSLSEGILPLQVTDPDARNLTFVACDDVGDAVAELLSDYSWSGFEASAMRGPDIMTARDAAARIAAALNREVSLEQISSSDRVDRLTRNGVAPNAAQVMAETAEIGGSLEYEDDATTRIGATSLDRFVRTRIAPAVAALSTDNN